MTELSYTAWDDNRYQWPPPDGWYQASDGKWWPEGYGPIAGQTTAEATAASEAADHEASVAAEPAEERIAGESEAAYGSVATDADLSAATAAQDADPEADLSESADHDREPFDDVDVADRSDEPVDEGDSDHRDSTFASDSNGAYESDPGTVAEPVDLTETDDPPDVALEGEPVYSAESPYATEADVSSSAGMAASGFAPRSESSASSLGLAGWAQPGASDVRSRVDTGSEYDYGDTAEQAENLLDPVEPTVEAGEDLVDGSLADSPSLDSSDQIDSTLSRLDDLQRQMEQQSFAAHTGPASVTTPISDLDIGRFDPTETLDIDPNDLTLESNPHYGAADESVGFGAPAGEMSAGAVAEGFENDFGTPDESGTDQVYGDPIEGEPDDYSYGMADAPAEAPEFPAADVGSYGYEQGVSGTTDDQTVAVDDGYAPPPAEQPGTTVLTPMSSPTPGPGRGRTLLWVLIGLLALAVAGVAGYLLFQLQGDDGETGTDGGDTSAAAGSDAGASDTSGQGAGSFTTPHELAGGVRLTVPVGDGDNEVWMLQVREPASTADLGNDLVEVTSRLRIRNDSADGAISASDLRFVLVSADGSSGTTAVASCTAGDDLSLDEEIEPGKDIEGNVCWTVPTDQASGALLGVESVNAGGRVHVQLG